jgi:hypothetical protein
MIQHVFQVLTGPVQLSDAPAETPSPEPLKRGKRKLKATDDEEDRDTKTSKCPWS